jgi:hypothetical protein
MKKQRLFSNLAGNNHREPIVDIAVPTKLDQPQIATPRDHISQVQLIGQIDGIDIWIQTDPRSVLQKKPNVPTTE